MEPFLGIKYVMVSEENFDAYMTFMGFGFMQRKLGLSLRPVQSLVRNEDSTYTFSFDSKLVSSSVTFTPGERFIETKADGVKVEALITFEDNKMVHVQVESNGRTSTHVREFHSDKLIVTTTAVGFDKIVTRTYKVVQ